jgi:hypothetical protein
MQDEKESKSLGKHGCLASGAVSIAASDTFLAEFVGAVKNHFILDSGASLPRGLNLWRFMQMRKAYECRHLFGNWESRAARNRTAPEQAAGRRYLLLTCCNGRE